MSRTQISTRFDDQLEVTYCHLGGVKISADWASEITHYLRTEWKAQPITFDRTGSLYDDCLVDIAANGTVVFTQYGWDDKVQFQTTVNELCKEAASK